MGKWGRIGEGYISSLPQSESCSSYNLIILFFLSGQFLNGISEKYSIFMWPSPLNTMHSSNKIIHPRTCYT